ncbi:hypothetical protein ACFW9F_29900, partial [Streptomyces sp. NPDC059506]
MPLHPAGHPTGRPADRGAQALSAALLAVLAVLSVLWAPTATARTAALRTAPAGTGAAVQAPGAGQALGPSRPGTA